MAFATASRQFKIATNAMLLAELSGDRVENRFVWFRDFKNRIVPSYICSGKLTCAHAERH